MIITLKQKEKCVCYSTNLILASTSKLLATNRITRTKLNKNKEVDFQVSIFMVLC